MTDIYTPAIRAFVAASLLLATVTLMFVAVNTARAAGALAVGSCGAYGEAYDYHTVEEARASRAVEMQRQRLPGGDDVEARLRGLRGRFHRSLWRQWLGPGAKAWQPRQNAALKACYEQGGKECVIRTFFCDAKG